jgi:peroxiredoxin
MKRWRAVVGLAAGLMTVLVFADVPDIPLRGLDGKARNAGEFIGKGKWTVVVAWAHDCHICSLEIHEMSDLHKARGGRDVTVLGVTIDGYERVKQSRTFVNKHKLPFVNLVAEPTQEVLMKFGAGEFVGTPTYYIYNPEGRIVGRNTGPVSRQEVETFIDTPGNAQPAGD